MIRVPGHVLDVAVQAHAGIEKHGDGRPGAVREAGPEKAVHGDAGFPQARCVRDADHAAMPEKAQRRISLIGPGPHGPGAPGASSPRTTGPATSPDWLRWVPPWRFGRPIPFFTLPAFVTPNTHGSKTPCRTPIFLDFEGAPRRPPAATRSATRPRTGESPISECALPRL